MKAIVQDRYGSPADVLKLGEIEPPVPADGDVLVRVEAAAVNIGDALVVQGVPYFLRLIFGLRRPKTPVPGTDFAGRVEAVGRNVTTLRPGDEVMGWSTGAVAEYAVAPQDHLMAKPASMAFEQAACLGVSAMTALQAVRDQARVEPGHRVLINGASGGVGSFAVQIAKALGAEVTGVCSTRSVETVQSLGADHVIDNTRDDYTRNGARYDVVIDVAGTQRLARSRRVLAPNGRLIPVGNVLLGRWLGGMHRLLGAFVVSLLDRRQGRPFISINNAEDLAAVSQLAESGAVRPVVDGTYPLSASAQAFEHVATGHARGKVVITM